MKIAVEGCIHGDLDNVFATLLHLEKVENTKIDLLICCGDFQNDLESLNAKPKYRRMNSFWKYYSGQEIAPFPTIFIGGNHEASNYLWELYYGGWAAPNIYFLGFAGVIKFGNIRIGGLSGVYDAQHYHLGHYERPPYNEKDIRSICHVREYDVYKLMQVQEPIDIFISHDWPVGITNQGNSEQLVHFKPNFEQEMQDHTLGSKAAADLLERLKPRYWCSAHLHSKVAASVQHRENGPVTKFLALDKCLPGRKSLQILEIESEHGPYEIHYDEEWLAITRKYNSIFPLSRKTTCLRNPQLNMQDREWIKSKLKTRGPKTFDFVQTVSPYDPNQSASSVSCSGQSRNPQTVCLLQFLELPYLLDVLDETEESRESKDDRTPFSSECNPQFTAELIAEGRLGLFRPRARTPTPVTINVTNYRDSIYQTLEAAMNRLLRKKTLFRTQNTADRVSQAAEYLADGCCLMTYMKLRALIFLDFPNRYNSISLRRPKSCTDLPIPAPFAFAIQQLGAVNYARKLGMQFAVVDVTKKRGTAWWLLRPVYSEECFHLQCSLPETNFTDSMALTYTLFMPSEPANPPKEMFDLAPLGQATYGSMLRDPHTGINVSTFEAIELKAPED
ncbi:hypothetical protein MKW92_022148 [Papaver armeniacum]|nr:hypothetical protein MKW92_022148 [Papaver armeniacum]